jgi:hypothetical protein
MIMKKLSLVCFAPVLFALVGCEASKSSTPLSPSVAGPIPGIEITAPKTLEPVSAKVAVDKQPVTLLIENASSTGPRPLTYAVEVAVDAAFTSKVFEQANVAPGEGGRTTLRLPDPLQSGRSYYWRARAQDGANTGPFSAPASFDVFTPILIEDPQLVAPAVNALEQPLRPTFIVNNAVRSGPVGNVRYMFELADSASFANKAFLDIPEQPNQTRLTAPQDLAYSTVYYWHVRAFDETTTGPWSLTRAFQTVARPVAPPPAPDPVPGGGGGGGGNWENCGSTPGDALSRCVVSAINPAKTVEGAFEVTKRVAWLLRGSGGGLLLKPGGENIITWKGRSFSAGRICFPDGHIYKVLSDVPTTNGPSWQDNAFVDRSLYVPAIDPR